MDCDSTQSNQFAKVRMLFGSQRLFDKRYRPLKKPQDQVLLFSASQTGLELHETGWLGKSLSQHVLYDLSFLTSPELSFPSSCGSGRLARSHRFYMFSVPGTARVRILQAFCSPQIEPWNLVNFQYCSHQQITRGKWFDSMLILQRRGRGNLGQHLRPCCICCILAAYCISIASEKEPKKLASICRLSTVKSIRQEAFLFDGCLSDGRYIWKCRTFGTCMTDMLKWSMPFVTTVQRRFSWMVLWWRRWRWWMISWFTGRPWCAKQPACECVSFSNIKLVTLQRSHPIISRFWLNEMWWAEQTHWHV